MVPEALRASGMARLSLRLFTALFSREALENNAVRVRPSLAVSEACASARRGGRLNRAIGLKFAFL